MEHEPILILSDDDYRRAFPPPKPPRRRWTRLAWAALIAAAAGAIVFAPRPETPAPPPPIVAVETPVVETAPPPLPPPATPAVEPPAPPVPAPEQAAPAEPPAKARVKRDPAAWNGGRAWVDVAMDLKVGTTVRASRHRVTVRWDGARYRLEQCDRASLDRLQLLLRPPPDVEGPSAGTEAIAFVDCDVRESGDVRAWTMPHPSQPALRVETPHWSRAVSRVVNETLRIDGADVACVLVEGEDRFEHSTRRFRCWFADDFPVGAVQTEVELDGVSLRASVLDFGPEPIPHATPPAISLFGARRP